MKDDYLWDGSGEPDPEIEELEKRLGSYRYQAKPLDARFEQQLAPRRPFFWVKYAAAAAIIVMAAVGAWRLAPADLPESELQAIARTPELLPLPGEGVIEELPPDLPTATDAATPAGKPEAVRIRVRKHLPQPEREGTRPAPVTTAPMESELAVASPVTNPFVDPETARHIERAQVLLRSFRNTEGSAEFDLSYEQQSSRRLLATNVLLRRAAESKGKLPIADLLGSLEPFLIDIANLPEAPTRDDVHAIKARMEKKEIITALQVYSAPILSQAF